MQKIHEKTEIKVSETDISYIKVLGVFYYFISIMDGYSRKILDWALCENMEGINIELLVARVKEKYPEAKARIIHDNGKQLTVLNGGATNGSGMRKSF